MLIFSMCSIIITLIFKFLCTLASIYVIFKLQRKLMFTKIQQPQPQQPRIIPGG